MQAIERAIISHFIASALDAGFRVHAVHDGEERHLMKPTHAGTVAEALTIIDSVDEAYVYFAKPGQRGETLVVILGNGEDCLSDMSCGRPDWDALVESEAKWAEGDVLSEVIEQQALQIQMLRDACDNHRARLTKLQTYAAEYKQGMDDQERVPTGEDWDNLHHRVVSA